LKLFSNRHQTQRVTIIVYKVPRFFPMLLTAIVALFFLYSTAHAEESGFDLNIKKQTISVNIRNMPLKDIIREIEDEKDIWFDTGFMRDKSLLDRDISVEFGAVNMQECLDRILSGINYSLFFNGDRIIGVMLLGRPDKRSYPGSRSTVRRSPARRSPFPRTR
jgi:hypothetical protein